MTFQPGQSGNPAGRPPGSKNKDWASLRFWYEKLEEVWDDLPKNERARLSVELFKVILTKRNLPADSPEDSKKNAEDAAKVLKEIMGGATGSDSGRNSVSESVGVAERVSGLQVAPDTAPHQNGVAGVEDQKP